MPHQSARLDLVFQSLADPTRRAVLKRLSKGPAQVSDLAKPFHMALPSFMQHLAVLEKNGLVKSLKSGRVRTYQLSPKPLELAENWLGKQRAIWDVRLDQLDEYLTKIYEE